MEKYDTVIRAASAISEFMTTYRDTKYATSFVPIKIQENGKLVDYNLLIVHEEAKKEAAFREIHERFKDGDLIEFLLPSENYGQIARLKNNYLDSYLTFDIRTADPENGIEEATIFDSRYQIIKDMMNDWYITKEQLGDSMKSDDIYQHAFVYGYMANKRDFHPKAKTLKKNK